MENSRSNRARRKKVEQDRTRWRGGDEKLKNEKNRRVLGSRDLFRSRSADIGWRTSPSTDLLAFNYVLRWLLANCLPLPAHYLSWTTERSCRDALRSKSRLKGNYTIQEFLSVKKKKKEKKKERSGTLWFRIVPNIYATLRRIHAILSDFWRLSSLHF